MNAGNNYHLIEGVKRILYLLEFLKGELRHAEEVPVQRSILEQNFLNGSSRDWCKLCGSVTAAKLGLNSPLRSLFFTRNK